MDGFGYMRIEAHITARYGPVEGNPDETPITYDAVADDGSPASVTNKAPKARRFLHVPILAAPLGSPCLLVLYNGEWGLYHVEESLPFGECEGGAF